MATMKHDPDHPNEVHDLGEFADPGHNVITPVLQLPPDVAQPVVTALAEIVQAGHRSAAATAEDKDGIIRAQVFEEGDVYMLCSPFDAYFADRYLMDFYDVKARDICSRMHFHTGLRFVRMMTGTDTAIRVSSLSPFQVTYIPGVTPFTLDSFTDRMPDSGAVRFNAVVPPCSWVDMQVPRGQSHQFNAIGPNAVIDSVHPEESIETFRERMSGYRMMAQTIFLADELPPAATCLNLPR